MIKRLLEQAVLQKFHKGKAIVIIGPRQTGKTTLLANIVSQYENCLTLNCDDPYVRNRLENINNEQLRQLIGNNTVVFIDEAQRVKNIGLTLKLIIDGMKDVQVFVSGSSSLDLANEINEPLTGRKWEYFLYPISWGEFQDHVGNLKAMQQLEQRIVYGMYPDVINQTGNERETLKLISDSYLYKDLLAFKGIRKPEILFKLLQALALQIGNQVSYNELANHLQIDKITIANYIDLLEKVFVIFRLQPFSRNLRNEINSSRKIYFYDTGVRNSIINNFNPLELRNDVGVLWENFIISERMKHCHYNQIYANTFFWRTHQQQEIDYVEERDGNLFAYEFKWVAASKHKIPKSFKDAYPEAEAKIIDKDNFLDFLK